MKRAALALAVFVSAFNVALVCAMPADLGSGLGFGYCSPPVIPSCIERVAHSRNRKDLDLCSRDVLRFTQTLGSYRGCLTRESERAIGTGNDAIARFRCLAQHRSACLTLRNGTVTLSP